MAYINIAEWTAEHVSEWLAGLDDAILPYAHFFINNNIDGRHLLTLLPDDLKHLNINKIGHQELILDGVDLLRQLHYTLTTETLQSLALRVGCKARSLYNDLKRNGPQQEENGKQERISVSTLSSVSDILIAVKAFVSWLDRYPFEGERQYAPVRKTVLKHSIELASTAQRDQFADKPHETIKNSCLQVAELCDKVIQEFNDSLIIQPASLDIVTIKRKPEEELGMHIHSSYSGVHTVGGVKFQSPVHRCGKVEIGDEIVQVNYQTVVGWQLKKLVYTMKEHPTELHLTLKKRPRHSNLLGQVIVLKPYRIPSRKTALARFHKWSESNSCSHIQENLNFPSRGRNAPLAIDEIEDDDDSAFLPDGLGVDKKLPIVRYQLFPVKSRATVQRRATVSGASPTVTRPPVSIEDLVAGVPNLKKEIVGRSISHDPSARHNGIDNRIMTNLKLDGKEEKSELTNGTNEKRDGLWPPTTATQEEESNLLESKTLEVPKIKRQGAKKVVPHLSPNIKSELKWEPSLNDKLQIPGSVSNKKPVTVLGKDQSSTKGPIFLKPNIGPEKQALPQNSNRYNLESSTECLVGNNKDDDKLTTNKDVPVVRRSDITKSQLKSSRRISVKELGIGDYNGWLYKRKEGKRLFSGPKWVKRWGIIKGNNIYFYKNKEDTRAECFVNLSGFLLSAAPDCKAKKYAFKLVSPSVSILLATDNLTDMTIWMTKMGLVAISNTTYNKPPPDLDTRRLEPLYSETEDETEDVNRHDLSHSASPSPVSTCSSDSLFSSSFLPASRKTSSEFGTRALNKSLSSCSQTDSDSQVSPRNPTGALKFSYQKPVKATSPQRTVAERPLERMVTESEVRKTNSKTKMATTTKTKGVPVMWHPEPPSAPLPPPPLPAPPYDSSSLGRFPQAIHKYIPSTLVPVQHSSSTTEVGTQSIPTKTGNVCPSNKGYVEPPPPLHPRGVKPNNGQSPVVPQSKPQVIRSYRNPPPIQRCTSLQKLSSNEVWPEKQETPPAEFISVLDREYNRLFGKKKPETIAPQSFEDQRNSPDSTRSGNGWWVTSIPRTATSQQIHSLYTSQDSWKSPSEHETPPVPERPPSTSRSLSMSSDMNISMSLLDQVNSRHCSPVSQSSGAKESPKVSSSGYESGTQSPSVVPSVSPCSSVDSSDTSHSKGSKFSLTKQFSPKSPSGSFHFFSSPKFIRKFSSPKQERKISQGQLKLTKHLEESNEKSPKTERKLLGSPKLARAIFRSPKQSTKPVTTTTTGVQTEHTFDELVRLHQQNTNMKRSPSKESVRSEDTSGTLSDKLLEVMDDRIKSSSNSSLNSNGSAVSSSGSFYVEARFRPQITISLPLVTEAGDDGGPRTPVKPTMGISMIGKKRSPSTSSERTTTEAGRGLGLEETLQEEEPREWAERSEITMLINTEEDDCSTPALSSEPSSSTLVSISSQEKDLDDLGQLVLALREICLTPMGVDIRQRRHQTMLQPSHNSKLGDLLLALRALQRTLADREREAAAIDELLAEPITSRRLEEWICCYPHLLPPDYC